MKFYVGDYTNLGGPGVCECELTKDGLRFIQNADTRIENPTWLILSADQKTLFATSSSPSDGEEGGSVATFDVAEGALRLTSMHSTAGHSVCHLTLSPDERFLYAASYGDGRLTVFPVSDGRIGKRVQLIQHEGSGPKPQQNCAHVHFTQFHPKDGRLYAVDLGIDAVMIYKQDAETGLLTLDERVDAPSGMGPRHLVFREDMMYVAHELGGAVSVFRNTSAGWQLEQTVSTMMEGCGDEDAVAAIRTLGDRLYVSNRRNDCIAEFEIRMGGTLALERTFSSFGAFPRDFVLLDEGLFLVANQNSGDIRLILAKPQGKPAPRKKRAPSGRLFTGSVFEERLTPIVGYTYLDEEYTNAGNEVCQIGDELPLPGAVCVCPVKE
ncbi:MAG: lactonase family protein [Clostridia bacterium]|nr:lactonase family protein [Clostridia bacterium]